MVSGADENLVIYFMWPIDQKGKLQISFDYVHSIVETDWKAQLKVD